MTAEDERRNSRIQRTITVGALVAATVTGAIGVVLRYYVELAIMLLAGVVALGLARARPNRRVAVVCVVGAVGVVVLVVVNRMITHEISVVNESGVAIEYLSINIDIGPNASSQYVLRNLAPGQRWNWSFRSLFADGSVQVDGSFQSGEPILGGSWNAEGGSYKGSNRILIQADGRVKVLRD